MSAQRTVGTDGANSVVRSWIASAMSDLGYFHDWLMVNLSSCGPAAERHFRPSA